MKTPANTLKAVVSAQPLDSYEFSAVRRAIVALLGPLGGICEFVKPSSAVLLKPNLLRPSSVESAAATHPSLVRAVAELARESGASDVLITDSPGLGTARGNARRLGLLDCASFNVVDPQEGVNRTTADASFHHLTLCRRMVEAECLLNLAKAKTHGQLLVTLAVKNCFGAVMGLEKPQWHFRAGRDPAAFARLIVHIHQLVAPRLNILDAVVAMEGNGPGAGVPRKLGLLLASTNAHALDRVFCRLWGLEAEQVPTLRAAEELGLLPEFENIAFEGCDLASFQLGLPWKFPRIVPLARVAGPVVGSTVLAPIVERLISLRPKVDIAKCTGCGLCRDHCAAGALALATKKAKPRIEIERDRCISCFCCQEICPEGAISVSSGWLAGLLKRN